jgi:serine O-acetyltransferase
MVAPSAGLMQRLVDRRQAYRVPAQLRSSAHSFAQTTLGTLFPHFSDRADCSEAAVREELIGIGEHLSRLERGVAQVTGLTQASVAQAFLDRLSDCHVLLEDDANAIFEGDPAATSVDEVLLTYPGFYAIGVYRLAHALHVLGVPLLPRLMTEHAHEKTGVDLHPAARIGSRFCIDHGTGVVIGETSLLGNGVKIYQGVTLGALTVEKALAGAKRHPTIEDDVVIYAGATILGGATTVGRGSVIAGNAWLTHSVPPNSVVSRKSEVRPRQPGEDALDWVI